MSSSASNAALDVAPFDEPAQAVRVYRYGCKRPALEVRDAIDEQLYLAHRYRRALWQLASASRAQYRERRRQHLPALAALEEQIERDQEALEALEEREERKTAVAALRKLRVAASALRTAAKGLEPFERDVAADRERERILGRALRNVYSRTHGLYCGSYMCVEDAARRARTGKHDPARPRWDGARIRDFHAPRRLHEAHGSGQLGIQIQNGITVAELESGRHPSVHLVLPTKGKRATLRYRLRSDERSKPVIIEVPIVYHRPLPPDARIKWAKLVVQRSGLRALYSVHFTLEAPSQAPADSGAGVVAVCLADDRIMIGDEYTAPREYSHDMRTGRAADLQAARDKRRNEMITKLDAWCAARENVPTWLRDELARQQARPSCRRLVRFVDALEAIADEPLRTALRTWAYRENHLYMWQSDMRTSALRRRKDTYRVLAAELRRKYRTLVLDDRELGAPKRLTHERRDLGLYELRTALKNAFGPRVLPATGATCAELFERLSDAQSPARARDDDFGPETGEILREGSRERGARTRKGGVSSGTARKARRK